MIRFLETIFFRGRVLVLALIAITTVVLGYEATKLRMDAGFYKGLADRPRIHRDLPRISRPPVRCEPRHHRRRNTKGDIWNKQFLNTLNDVTQDVFYLPGVDRRTVTSLWTPNTRILEITEDGISARDVIPGKITPEEMEGVAIKQLKNDVLKGNLVGRFVSNDFTASLIVAELLEYDPGTQKKLDYIDLGTQLEQKIRQKFEKGDLKIHIIGFAKNISDIAKGGLEATPIFFGGAFLLTVFAVYFYCRNWQLTWLTVGCSLTTVVWQFGLLTVLGYGLDPLAILVPFLVFAIGTSHGVQQLNMITSELSHGLTPEAAARSSFRGLLIPGSLSLDHRCRRLRRPLHRADSANSGTCGHRLDRYRPKADLEPDHAAGHRLYFTFDEGYRERISRAREQRLRVREDLMGVSEPGGSLPDDFMFLFLFAGAIYASKDRHVGDLHAGSPATSALLARYNVDAQTISKKFSVGLDLFTIVVETPPQACVNYVVYELSERVQLVDG